jgi:DNA replication protein DnaC
MLTEEQFKKLPECSDCKNTGWFKKRIMNEKDAIEFDGEPGEEVNVKCPKCYRIGMRIDTYIKRKDLEETIKYFEISDYDATACKAMYQIEENKKSIELFKELIAGIDKLFKRGKFILLIGPTLAGKSTFAHIFIREACLKGYTFMITDIYEFIEEVSHVKAGSFAERNEEVLYDINKYIEPDVLVFDDMDMVNEYMKYPNLSRANLMMMLKARRDQKKVTLILSQKSFEEIFTVMPGEYSPPADLTRIINKNYERLSVYGRFGKRKKVKEVKEE